jgi:hypothetical protein
MLTTIKPKTYLKFVKIVSFHQNAHFECLSFKMRKKLFTYDDFLKVGYLPGFYSSLNDNKQGNGEVLKNEVYFYVFYGCCKTHEYTGNSENSFQNIAISSFVISQ